MRTPSFLLLSALLLAPLAALADSEVRFSYGGMADLQGMYYPEPLAPNVNQALGVLNLEANGTVRIGRNYLFKARPTFHLDPANKSESEQWWGELPEGYGQLRYTIAEGTTFYGQLGFNTFTWGVTDGFNPVDVVNQRRLADPLRSEKLGVFAAVTKFDFSGLVVEGIFIPFQRRSKLPDVNSRWLPYELEGDELVQSGITFKLPERHSFYYRPEEEVDNALRYNAGLRIAGHAAGADLALYAFNGAAVVPALNLKLTSIFTSVVPGKERVHVDPNIGLRPVYYRVNMVGGSVVMPVGNVLVRTEAAYTTPITKQHADRLPGPATEAVFELEHTFSGEKSSLTVIALATYAQHDDPAASSTSAPSISRIFDRGLALGLRWQPAPGFAADAFAVADLKHGGQLYNASGTKTIHDNWKLYASTEHFHGKISTPAGVYRKNQRYIGGLRVAF